MRQVKKFVTARELYDVLCAKAKKYGDPMPDWDGFIYQLSVTFTRAPSMEFRFHDLHDGVDMIYILKHQEIASVLAHPEPPRSDDAL